MTGAHETGAPVGVEEVLRDLRVWHDDIGRLPRSIMGGRSRFIVLAKVADDEVSTLFAVFYRATDSMRDIDRALKLIFPTIITWGMNVRISGTDRGVFAMLERYRT